MITNQQLGILAIIVGILAVITLYTIGFWFASLFSLASRPRSKRVACDVDANGNIRVSKPKSSGKTLEQCIYPVWDEALPEPEEDCRITISKPDTLLLPPGTKALPSGAHDLLEVSYEEKKSA